MDDNELIIPQWRLEELATISAMQDAYHDLVVNCLGSAEEPTTKLVSNE